METTKGPSLMEFQQASTEDQGPVQLGEQGSGSQGVCRKLQLNTGALTLSGESKTLPLISGTTLGKFPQNAVLTALADECSAILLCGGAKLTFLTLGRLSPWQCHCHSDNLHILSHLLL